MPSRPPQAAVPNQAAVRGRPRSRPTQAAELHRAAVRASSSGRPTQAAKLLRRALTLIDDEQTPGTRTPDAARAELAVRVQLSMAWVQSELGETSLGLEMLDAVRGRLPADTDAPLWGVWHGQRGLLRARAGQLDGALVDLGLAVHRLESDPRELVRCLLNQGGLLLWTGRLEDAREALTRCLEVARSQDATTVAAKCTANLGYLSYLEGDLPEAFRLFDTSDEIAGPAEPGLRAVTAESRTRALIAAGLVAEARDELTAAAAWLRRQRLSHDLAEAELGLATINGVLQRPAAARRLARAAAQRFRSRGATGSALVADLLMAQLRLHDRPGAAAEAAAVLVKPLLDQHLEDDALLAQLVHVQGLLRSDQVTAALAEASSLEWPSSRHRVATRLVGHETRAALADAAGQAGSAQRWRRQGLAVLASHQASFGSVDLKTAASSAGRRLAEGGLSEALRSGRPAAVLQWSERVRATSARVPAVRPVADPELNAMLARLRHLRRQVREQSVAGEASEVEQRAVSELERTVRRRAWHAQGSATVHQIASLAKVQESLGADGSLVQLTASQGRVVAVVVTPDAAAVRPVGSVRMLREVALRMRSDLDQCASPTLPPDLRDVVRGSLAAGLAQLSRLLAPALRATLADGPVQVVPSGVLTGVPWTLLDGLARRPVSVSMSASWWVRARAAAAPARPGGAVVVAGPELLHAGAEARRVAGVLRRGGSRVAAMSGRRATAAAVLKAADGADVLHVAAHGRHVTGSPLLSSLLLTDGQLFGYDLQTVPRPPRHVVLSACDAGRCTQRSGEETLGLTAALLHAGTTSVVAAVARIDDEAAGRVAVRYHRQGLAGHRPAAALLDATTAPDGADAVPLVCFGAGW